MSIDKNGQHESNASETDSGPNASTIVSRLTAEVFDVYVSDIFFIDLNCAIVSPSLEPAFEQLENKGLVELTLMEVLRYPDNGSRMENAGREPFALLFRGSHQQPLISATYAVSHASLADSNLFLNPVQSSSNHGTDSNAEGLIYECVFT